MTLADTSIWVAWFKGAATADPLGGLLERGEVATHAWVLGELALGGLSADHRALFKGLATLPEIAAAEVLELVEAERLAGSGLGWVDCQLLASALVAGAGLWTRDQRLADAARVLGISVEPA